MKLNVKIKKSLFYLIVLLLAYILSFHLRGGIDITPPLSSPLTTTAPSPTPANLYHRVSRVIDGDTIELEDGQKVRYIGIDTPETVDPNKSAGCYGKEASGENKKLVEGKFVKLEKDITDKDKYGRLLRYVWVDDIFVNDYLVHRGFALVSTYPPDVRYQDQFVQAQKEATASLRGIWGNCL